MHQLLSRLPNRERAALGHLLFVRLLKAHSHVLDDWDERHLSSGYWKFLKLFRLDCEVNVEAMKTLIDM